MLSRVVLLIFSEVISVSARVSLSALDWILRSRSAIRISFSTFGLVIRVRLSIITC
jgi:hypothetical protein